jgi:hypothetical protein
MEKGGEEISEEGGGEADKRKNYKTYRVFFWVTVPIPVILIPTLSLRRV